VAAVAVAARWLADRGAKQVLKRGTSAADRFPKPKVAGSRPVVRFTLERDTRRCSAGQGAVNELADGHGGTVSGYRKVGLAQRESTEPVSGLASPPAFNAARKEELPLRAS
jgi:hypothetical protein